VAISPHDQICSGAGILAKGVVDDRTNRIVQAPDLDVSNYADDRDWWRLYACVHEPAANRIAPGKDPIRHALADDDHRWISRLVTRVECASGGQRNTERLEILLINGADVRFNFLTRRRNRIAFDVDASGIPSLERQNVHSADAIDARQRSHALAELVEVSYLTVYVGILCRRQRYRHRQHVLRIEADV